jgi:hypothetical protein
MTSLVIPARFNGPRSSGNGGYTAGALAEASGLTGIVTVQLRRPPPLDVPLRVVAVDEQVELIDGTGVVAVATIDAEISWTRTEPVGLERARSLEASYVGLTAHPFPTCFSCGPDREPGDGLRIFPGRLDDSRVAASWTPDLGLGDAEGAVSTPVTWAALDCVSAWSTDLLGRPMVLAQIAARVDGPPTPGAPYVVVGTHVRTEGRKTWTASAMFDIDGVLVGQAEQLWITVDPAVLSRLQG